MIGNRSSEVTPLPQSSLPAVQHEPWRDPWPVHELEYVKICPVCGNAERRLLHDQLVDNVFFVAPGRWSLFKCMHCQSAYLDPRPTPDSIGRAYDAYYTHSAHETKTEFEHLNRLRRLRRILANGYSNHRYGTSYQPASQLGVFAALLLPWMRHAIDVQFRCLPKPVRGQRLLDVGCGNGSFLYGAQQAGWDVMGLDLDPKAAAIHKDLNVRIGTIDLLSGESECFDFISINHVIEHVHEPEQLLRAIHRLLKPGGVLYVETPNIESHGARVFGVNWRGLEPPRHLVLFSEKSLSSLLFKIGFSNLSLKRRTSSARNLFLYSLRMSLGKSPSHPKPSRLPWPMNIWLILKLPFISRYKQEFIVLTAVKGIA